MKKRMLALLMTIVMSLSLLPMSTLATGGESPHRKNLYQLLLQRLAI